MQTIKPSVLPPLYYLDNFLTLLNSVECQYGDLLTAHELALVKKFRSLEKHAQALLVRLYSRQGCLFRSDKLSYSELPDLACLMNEIERTGFIQCNPELSIIELLTLNTCREIRLWWSDQLDLSSGNIHKATLIETLSHIRSDQYYQWVPYIVISVEHQELIALLLLLFFGHPDQNLSTFITTELGYTQYEDYSLARKDRLFRKRVDIEHALDLMQLRATFHNIETFDAEAGQYLLTQLPTVANNSPVKSRHDRLCNRIGRALERFSANQLALQSYQRSLLPPSRERQARIHLKEGNNNKALILCDKMLKQPLNEAEIQFATFFKPRCLKKAGVKVTRNRRFQPATESIILEKDCNPEITVEALASRSIMESAGGACFYIENWLFNAVFGLTFWQTIFADVPGAFTHPFQVGPHDLYEPSFCEKRKDHISNALARVGTQTWPKELQQRWQQKYSIRNPFVNWSPKGWQLIAIALERIPRDDWCFVFRRMLRDPGNNCSGLPDLIHFPERAGYRLLEVKSPTDKVQPNQLRWMQSFDQKKIPYALIQVKWKSVSCQSNYGQ